MALFKKESQSDYTSVTQHQESASTGRKSSQSLIGKGLKVTGEIKGDEDILVEGVVDGKISISKAIIIGPTGNVKADLEADIVSVQGRVNGDIIARHKVILKPTAKVTGNITCPSFIVNEGAGFEGNINMVELDKKKAPTHLQKSILTDQTPKKADENKK